MPFLLRLRSFLLQIASTFALLAPLGFAFLALASLPQPSAEGLVAVPPGDNVTLGDIVASGQLPELRWPDFSDYKPELTEFYQSTGYSSAWVHDRQPSPQALVMIEAFKNAWRKGLDPEDYDASRWDGRLRALKDSGIDPARFDVTVTVCTMRFVSDLHIGRIHPKHFNFGLSIESKKYDLAQFLRDRLLTATNPSAVLNDVEPPFAGYRRSQTALVRYMELARTDDGQKLPRPAKPINPGQSYSALPRIHKLLLITGDLPPDANRATDSQLYDDALVQAVKRFQRRHGLKDDGRLEPETIKQLNVPFSERARQLQLSLERWRWLPSEFSSPPIVVNIPDFRLRALDESNTVALNMRVVVGKAMRTQTPVFSRDMAYIVLRPYWNVPPSILRGEIVPAIQRDRHYIANRNYEVTTADGDVVTSGAISDDVLAQLRAAKLAVRQKPGPRNALGLVKLMFPNEFNVYLHSTPAPELFSRTRRDFSHGCIRVEKPAELAAWALRNNPGWTLERVQQSMQTGADNVTVTLTRRIPVFIVYTTALAYDNGEVHFYEDIYGHDARLAEALAKGYPYP
jgi:L,D-transpeptidase YcbB